MEELKEKQKMEELKEKRKGNLLKELFVLFIAIILCCFGEGPFYMRFDRPVVPKQRMLIEYETHNYTQILDHFTFVSEGSRTFQQRYLVNKTYWGGAMSNSPIFVYVGGEPDIEGYIWSGGIMTDNAPQFKALLLFIEHRYYGKSLPDLVHDPSYIPNDARFGHLNSKQALADYATLITDFKKNLSAENSPVIVFGGSYAGMLAAWLRLKYPHITIGALASSAPILLFHNLTPYYRFSAVVTKDFRDASESCYTIIKNSWNEMDRLASQPGGLQSLSKLFNTCSNLTDVTALHDALFVIFTVAAQNGYTAVKKTCHTIDSAREGAGVLGRVSAGTNFFIGKYTSSSCVDTAGLTVGLWTWQTCTEMVFPIGHNPNKTMFPLKLFDIKSYAENCKRDYGALSRPNWVTTEYGGRDIRNVLKHFGSNIIFSNGLRDPWSSGGVLENISESIVALVTKEGIHCQDLTSMPSPDDPEWLKEQRSKEIEIVKRWIEQYNSDFLHK